MNGVLIFLTLLGYTIPHFEITPQNEVICTFKTRRPSTQANVYYTLVPDSFPTPAFLEDYMFNHWDARTVDTVHSFKLKYIEPGKLYLVKVLAVDVKRGRVEVSAPYPLRVVEKDGKFRLGLVIEGPHIGYREPDTYVIFFDTNRKTRAKVIYGVDKLNESYEDTISATRHEVPLRELKAGKKYYYRVLVYDEDDTLISPLFYFRTEGIGALKFAVMGDSRNNYRRPDPEFRVNGVNLPIVRRLTWEAFKRGAEFIVFVGDLINGYTEDTTYVKLQYKTWWWATWPASAYLPVFGVMGNHDATAPMKRLSKKEYIDPPPPFSAENFFARYFVHPENGPETKEGPPYKENVYSFNWGDAHIVVLNSDYRYGKIKGRYTSKVVDSIQVKWLVEDLKKEKERAKFVFLHEPPYPVSGHYGSSLDYNEKARDYLILTLSTFNVEAIFAGHEHCYARMVIDQRLNPHIKNPLFEFITGRAGAPSYRLTGKLPYMENLKKFSTDFHFIMVNVNDGIIYETINLYGETIDEVKVDKR